MVHHCVSARMLFQGMLTAFGAGEHRLKGLRVNHQECFIALQLTASSQHCGSSLMCSAESLNARMLKAVDAGMMLRLHSKQFPEYRGGRIKTPK